MFFKGLLSPLLGLSGTIILFFFGLPPRVSKDGTINLILEQQDEGEAKKYKLYKNGFFLFVLPELVGSIKEANNSYYQRIPEQEMVEVFIKALDFCKKTQ